MISAAPANSIMKPTISTADAVAITVLASAIIPAISENTPNATIQPHLGRSARMLSPRLCGPVLSVLVMACAFSAEWDVRSVRPPHGAVPPCV
jgi:hypothetical protein